MGSVIGEGCDGPLLETGTRSRAGLVSRCLSYSRNGNPSSPHEGALTWSSGPTCNPVLRLSD